MFTRCPECQRTQSLTIEQLRANRGMVRCIHCSELFDALMHISETEATNTIESIPATPLPWDKRKQSGVIYWRIGLVFGLTLLIVQLVYFKGHLLSQKPELRLWAEKICSMLDCKLPIYTNSDEFEILHRSLTPLADQTYVFKVVASNQAAFRQKYPKIRLTLLDFNGQAFAHRLFIPKDYLADAISDGAIEANATMEISLKIAALKTKVGGYDFDFIY